MPLTRRRSPTRRRLRRRPGSSRTMQLSVKNLAAEDVGVVELSEAIFGVEVRVDILHRVVTWQLAKRRAGTHKVKTRAEIWRTGAKMYKQKGTGRARHGSRRVN